MSQVRANGIHLEVETLGDSEDPAILLIMGLGAQLTAWPQGFCEKLVGLGYHVVLFDNRDVGLSTWFDDAPEPNMVVAYLGSLVGRRPSHIPGYISQLWICLPWKWRSAKTGGRLRCG